MDGRPLVSSMIFGSIRLSLHITTCSNIKFSIFWTLFSSFNRSGRRSAMRTSDALPNAHTQNAPRLQRNESQILKYSESVIFLGTTKCCGRALSLDGYSFDRTRQAPVWEDMPQRSSSCVQSCWSRNVRIERVVL